MYARPILSKTITPKQNVMTSHPDVAERSAPLLTHTLDRLEYETLLMIILTPTPLLNPIFHYWIPHDDYIRDSVFNILITRKIEIEHQALLIPGFRDFIFGQRDYAEKVIGELKKRNAVSVSDEAEIRNKSLLLSTLSQLENYVLNNSLFPRTYKKTFLKNMLTDLVEKLNNDDELLAIINFIMWHPKYSILREVNKEHNWNNLWGYWPSESSISDTVITLVTRAKEKIKNLVITLISRQTLLDSIWGMIKELETNKKYDLIRLRENTPAELFLGHSHKDQPVSAIFSDIMHAAKYKMLDLIKTNNIVNIRKEHRDFIDDHRYGHLKSIYGFFDKKTKSGEQLENLVRDTKLSGMTIDPIFDAVCVPKL